MRRRRRRSWLQKKKKEGLIRARNISHNCLKLTRAATSLDGELASVGQVGRGTELESIVRAGGSVSGDLPGVATLGSIDVGSNYGDGLQSSGRALGKDDLGDGLDSRVNPKKMSVGQPLDIYLVCTGSLPGDDSILTGSVDGASKGGSDTENVGRILSRDRGNSEGGNGGNDGFHVKER